MGNALERSIANLHQELAVMSGYIERSMDNMSRVLSSRDNSIIDLVINDDDLIDNAESHIEQLCTCTIARHKPSAHDLREITAIFKIITDLERIGDHCSDIVKQVRHLGDEPYMKELEHIPLMVKEVKSMVRNSIDCFIMKDLELAKAVHERDDVVDELCGIVYQELVERMEADSSCVRQGMILWTIAKYLERMGDHATNICEWIMYNLTGERSMDEEITCSAME